MEGVDTGRRPMGIAVAFVVLATAWGCSSNEGTDSDTVEGSGNGAGGVQDASGGTASGTGGGDLGTGGLGIGGSDPGTGGSDPGTGGSDPGTGGSDPGTGGSDPGTGGSDPGTGGSDPGTGGSDPGTGGSDPGTGGSDPGTGGSDPGTGGSDPGTGGSDPGTGGSDPGTGGSDPGTGGSDPGTGGAPPTPTSGCDAATWPDNGRYSIDVDGTTREYVFTAPDGYDATVPMKLIFVWHGLGGTIDTMDSQFFSYYGMGSVNDGSAILVAGQGLGTADDPTGYGWRNTDGEDVAFTRAMVDWFSSNFCIDADRIFSTGMSYGGVMSNTVGCEVGDVMRAIAPIAGAGPGFGGFGTPDCVGPVAALLIHGTADETVPLTSGEDSRDYWLGANGCGTTTAPVDPTEYCVAYDGCGAGTPVVWCVHDGGHTIPDFSAQAIWDFFVQF